MTRETMEGIDALLDGTISREEFAKLQDVLRDDRTAFEHYCRQSELHGRLEWEFGDPQRQFFTVSEPETASVAIAQSRPGPWMWVAAAASIVVMTGLLVLQIRSNDPGPPSGAGVAAPVLSVMPETSVARLTKSQASQWDRGEFSEGAWLSPGPLRLLAGSAELTFDSGARIILQAPAEMELVDAHHGRLVRGKATVHIPSQASGFELETPSTSFSDQDSSFSLAVDADGETEVHVLRGLVEATPRANRELARVLSGNEALRMTDSIFLARHQIRYASGEFDPELPPSLRAAPGRFLRWTFDTVESGRVSETGMHRGTPFPAQVLARPGTSEHASAELVDGKFGKAVYFNGRGAFLSSGFPGIAGSAARTVSFWVRIPPDTRDGQAYAMVAWGSPQSQLGGKWQIAWNRDVVGPGVKGAIRTEFGGGYVIGTTDLRDGRWHHIAAVYLGGSSEDVAGQIRHYVDGRLEPVSAFKSQKINTRLTDPSSRPTYIGRRLEDDWKGVGFKGAIDELFVFPAALTPVQIEQLYLENTPPRTFVSAGS